MKVLGRAMAALAVVLLSTGLAAQAPKLDGQWQGTLEVGKSLRIVIVIATNAAGGGYTSTFYSIDQSPNGIAASTTVQGNTVRIAVTAAGITFDGKLSPDGNSIAGNFLQGATPLPFTLVRATKETAFALPTALRPMAADAPMAFEVATVKPSNPTQPGIGITMRGPDIITINTPLSYLISFVYGLHPRQIIGGPSWMESEKFDITGRPQVPGVPNVTQFRALLRTLIEDRFKLTTQTDKRSLPAYALVLGGQDTKLLKNDTNPNGPPGIGFKAPGVMVVANDTMGEVAGGLQNNVMDRPVIDRTGLQGRFDFTLSWTPDESQFRGMGLQIPPPPADAKLPGLFTAIQEQLGLRLESVNAPVEVIVIDRVERPSEN